MRINILPGALLLITLNLSLNAKEAPWQHVSTPTDDGLHDIEWVNRDVGYAYTYGTGLVLKSTDGGESWHITHRLDSIYYEQIHFFDEETGWICGNKNKLLKTSDGGETWTEHSVASDTNGMAFYGMAFKSRQTGYLAQLVPKGKSLHTRIFKTSDSGQSWQEVLTFQEMILNLEWHQGRLWGSGTNVIIRNIQKPNKWKYSFRDTAGKTGQIRDLEFTSGDRIKAVSFKGYVLSKPADNKTWSQEQITQNRLRSIKHTGKNNWIAAGDSTKEAGRIFIKQGNKNWEQSADSYPDVHRLETRKNQVWAAGKEGLLMYRDF